MPAAMETAGILGTTVGLIRMRGFPRSSNIRSALGIFSIGMPA